MKNYFGYENKNCIVTGAASGMGEAACEILVNLGANVYALDVNPCNVSGITNFIQTDLSQKASIEAVFEKLPTHIDCFFGVAGLSGLKTDFPTTFTVSFTANRFMLENYLPERMEKGGAIVFVTSTAGSEWQYFKDQIEGVVKAHGWEETQKAISQLGNAQTPGPAAYLFSKISMTYYANLLSYEWGEKGIRVNVVLPGSTDTGMKNEFETLAGGADNLVAQAGTAKRLATSKEMAGPIVFLNSDMATFVSGEEFYVDAGDGAMVRTGIKKSLYRQ